MENLQYLFAAYTAIWLVHFTYIMRLQKRTKELGQELERLSQDLSPKADPAAD